VRAQRLCALIGMNDIAQHFIEVYLNNENDPLRQICGRVQVNEMLSSEVLMKKEEGNNDSS
jgi:hypothetical protein